MPNESADEHVRQKLEEVKGQHNDFRNYIYSDEQRRKTIQLVVDAMEVLRGEEDYEAITVRYKIWGQTKNVGDWREYRGGYRDNLDVVNDWSPAYFSLTISSSGKPEPYRFYLQFMPAIHGIRRSELEELLQLKVIHGWKKDGGNMLSPGFDIHSGSPIRDATLEYSPLKEPESDYTIEVVLDFDGATDASLDSLYAANLLGSIEIIRKYLTPAQKLKRSREHVGNLPHTGDPVPETARYEPVFDDETLQARAARYPVRSWEFKAGEKFGSAWLHAPDGEQIPFPAFWRRSTN